MRGTKADVSSANKIIRKSVGSRAPHTPFATAWLTVALRWRPPASHPQRLALGRARQRTAEIVRG